MQFVKIDSKDKIDERLSTLKNILLAWDYSSACKLEVKKHTNARSLSQNALMHMWFQQINDRFTAMGMKINGEPITEEDVKLMMKHRFLGVKDIVRGKLVIPNQLVSTKDLDSGEMTHF